MPEGESDHPGFDGLGDLDPPDHGSFDSILEIPYPFRICGGDHFDPVAILQPQPVRISFVDDHPVFRLNGQEPIVNDSPRFAVRNIPLGEELEIADEAVRFQGPPPQGGWMGR
jgi:hypothetical protein